MEEPKFYSMDIEKGSTSSLLVSSLSGQGEWEAMRLSSRLDPFFPFICSLKDGPEIQLFFPPVETHYAVWVHLSISSYILRQ